jgi:hypothetical protein
MTKVMMGRCIRRVAACLLVLGLGLVAHAAQASEITVMEPATVAAPLAQDDGKACDHTGLAKTCAPAACAASTGCAVLLVDVTAPLVVAPGTFVASRETSGRDRTTAPDPFPPRPFPTA